MFLFDIKVQILGETFSKSFIIYTFEVVKPTSVSKNMKTKIIVIRVATIIWELLCGTHCARGSTSAITSPREVWIPVLSLDLRKPQEGLIACLRPEKPVWKFSWLCLKSQRTPLAFDNAIYTLVGEMKPLCMNWVSAVARVSFSCDMELSLACELIVEPYGV